ncbi:MAG: carbonic anhydrase [Legionellales bacterium]|nr:carbonic anhydrase [Legionellales bacterium]
MKKSFEKILQGYQQFRKRYAQADDSIMQLLSRRGQHPEFMIVACCDSRVDPALILQCEPGELFIVRNVANIVPPYENDESYHGTSAALEFGICYLQVKHLVILGHSQCGGIQALLNQQTLAQQNDFIGHWVSLIAGDQSVHTSVDSQAKAALSLSHANCLTFPWIRQRVDQQQLSIHRWFFDIESAEITAYHAPSQDYLPLEKAFIHQSRQDS